MREAKQLDLIEEWLVESLTQPLLANYLNKTKYEGADISSVKENKSIFQKIIDVIIKLFNKIFGVNFGEIKNNTIFAKQYLILSDKLNAPPTNQEVTKFNENQTKDKQFVQGELFTEEDNEDEGSQPVEGTTDEQSKEPIVPEPDREYEEFIEGLFGEDDNYESTDKIYSEIPLIIDDDATTEEKVITEAKFNENTNPNGVMYAETMKDFETEFDRDIQPKIAILLANGKINYLC